MNKCGICGSSVRKNYVYRPHCSYQCFMIGQAMILLEENGYTVSKRDNNK